MSKNQESKIVRDLKIWAQDYEHSQIAAILLVLVPIIGIIFMWKATKWSNFTKIFVTIAYPIIFILMLNLVINGSYEAEPYTKNMVTPLPSVVKLKN